MLEGLDAIDWENLTHAYGQAAGIPERIHLLTSPDPNKWVNAMSDLYDALCHQMCSVYPATTPAIPFLIEILDYREVRCRGRILGFLSDVAFLGSEQPQDVAEDDEFEDNDDDELIQQTLEAVWKGLDLYLDLLTDLDERIRVVVPYLLGALASCDQRGIPDEISSTDVLTTIADQMKAQFDEEPNELVRASLVFALACFVKHDHQILDWIKNQLTDPHAGSPVKIAAVLCLIERCPTVSNSVMDVLLPALQQPAQTNVVFKSDHPEMESKYHPIGRAMLEYQGRLENDVADQSEIGIYEDMKFPWPDQWVSGWVTFRMLALLAKSKCDDVERLIPALTPYLDQANESTGDSLVIPILRIVFGEQKRTPDVRREELSSAQYKVLLHLFNNLQLWATDHHLEMFAATGLGERREDWAKLLGIESNLTDTAIKEFLNQLITEQKRTETDTVEEIRLCRIGSPAFLPHLKQYTSLKILDLANTSFGDEQMAELAVFSDLKLLRLNNTSISDAGVQHLAALSNLEELYLFNTDVTDKCLEFLGGLTRLKYLCLSQTAVTDNAARLFMDRYPRCRISK